MKTEQDKIIGRIIKLLAMAEDASSPNEALIAAQRARKLMDQHQVTKSDLEITGSQFLKTQADMNSKIRQRWLLSLAAASAALNDCRTHSSTKSAIYYFEGFKADAVVAKLTMDYLVTTCNRLSKDFSGHKRSCYKLGFSRAVRTRANALKKERNNLKTTTGTGLMVIKAQAIEKHFGCLISIKLSNLSQPSASEQKAYLKGVEAGDKVSLDKQVTDESKSALQVA